ncbi:MAG: hypothetical protein ACOY93_09570 [Bacillota bacterium]
MLRWKPWVSVQQDLSAELRFADGCLRLVRRPHAVLIEWAHRRPRPPLFVTTLGLWLRACVAGSAPAGRLRHAGDMPACIVDSGGLLLLRTPELTEWLAVRPNGCDLQQVRSALGRALRGQGAYSVRSPYEAEVEAEVGHFRLRLQQRWMTAVQQEGPVAPPGEPWPLLRFLKPCLYRRDGTPLARLRPADLGVFPEAGRSFRTRLRTSHPLGLDITEAFLGDLWSPEAIVLGMTLDNRSWVVQTPEAAWSAAVTGGRLTITGVTDRRFSLHQFRNANILLTDHGDERFRLRIATKWELICGLPPVRRDLDTKFLLQRLKSQRHLVAAAFGRTVVLATTEVTAVLKTQGRSAVVVSVWPTHLDHPRAVEEAVLRHLAEPEKLTAAAVMPGEPVPLMG